MKPKSSQIENPPSKNVIVITQIDSNPKRKRNAKISFRQAIEDILERNQGLPKSQNPSDSKYTIYQDLKLILEMRQIKTINLQLFEGFQKRKLLKYKSAKSMMQRHVKVLDYVKRDQMKKILEHIRNLGMFGIIVRDNSSIQICLESNVESSQKLSSSQDLDCLVQIQKVNQIHEKQADNQQQIQIQVDKEKKNQKQINQNQNQKPLFQNAQQQSDSLLAIQRITQSQWITLQINNNNDKNHNPHQLQVQQLKKVIDFYSQQFDLDPIYLVKLLGQLSGDMIALDWYIQIKDQKLKWTSRQDQSLIQDNQQLIAYLIQKRGRTNVSLRRKYLGL